MMTSLFFSRTIFSIHDIKTKTTVDNISSFYKTLNVPSKVPIFSTLTTA